MRGCEYRLWNGILFIRITVKRWWVMWLGGWGLMYSWVTRTFGLNWVSASISESNVEVLSLCSVSLCASFTDVCWWNLYVQVGMVRVEKEWSYGPAILGWWFRQTTMQEAGVVFPHAESCIIEVCWRILWLPCIVEIDSLFRSLPHVGGHGFAGHSCWW